MSDQNQTPPELPVEAGETGVSDGDMAIFAAWVETLGPEGAQIATQAGALLSAVGQLMQETGVAAEAGLVAPLEELERRAKIFKAQSAAVPVDWVRAMVDGAESFAGAMAHLARGNRCGMEWRHERAQHEFQLCGARITEATQLFQETIEKAPPVEMIRQAFGPALHMASATGSLVGVLEKQAKLDTHLLAGRVRGYVEGVRALAGELRWQSDTVLQSGAEEPVVLQLSKKFYDLGMVMTSRADAIEQSYKAEEAYLSPTGDKVFIIHGHAEAKWRELRDLLEGRLGLRGRVVVLKEESSQTRTVLEKFATIANECCFAIALVTPDDLVRKEADTYGQARPNVLFELGWFFGRYGPERTCIMKQADTPVPSDLGGVVTLEFQTSVDEQYIALEKELVSANVIAETTR